MERNDQLIKNKFYRYLLPGVMMVAAMQLGNLVDSIFVGNLLGSNALSAQNLAMPIVLVSQIPILILSVGGSVVAAVCLGKREKDKASMIFSASMISVFLINAVHAFASLFYVKPLSLILAGSSGLENMVQPYMLVYVLGMPIVGIALMLSYFLGVDNHPGESALLHIIANVINLVTDFIYIRILHMGTMGSALSTVTGYGVAAVIFGIIYAKSKRRTLSLKWKGIFQDKELYVSALKNGLSNGLIYIFTSVKMVILNGAILAFTGNDGMSIYALCINSFFLVQLCLHGITGVIQTVVGVLYGEMDYFGIRVVLKRVIRISLLVAAALMALFIAAPLVIQHMFGYNDVMLQSLANECLRVYAISFAAYTFNNIYQVYYSTIEKPFLATLNTILQGFVVLIPVTLILLPFIGVVGTSIASVIAEAAALMIVIFLRIRMQKRGKLPGRRMDLLPDVVKERFLDVTIQGNDHNAAGLAHSFMDYCQEEGIGSRTANLLAVAAEELVHNIGCYGSNDRSSIDVCLIREEDRIVLRVRDDGPLFNPLQTADTKTPEDLTGIGIIKSLALKLDYSRVLNMNNTIVEISSNIGENV